MIHHPLTDNGIVRFRADWEAAQAATGDPSIDGKETAR
jgi:hypothetical protein